MNILNSVFAMKMLHRGHRATEQAKQASEELKEKLTFAMDANKNKQEVAHVVAK
jgi:ribosomal protein L23